MARFRTKNSPTALPDEAAAEGLVVSLPRYTVKGVRVEGMPVEKMPPPPSGGWIAVYSFELWGKPVPREATFPNNNELQPAWPKFAGIAHG